MILLSKSITFVSYISLILRCMYGVDLLSYSLISNKLYSVLIDLKSNYQSVSMKDESI